MQDVINFDLLKEYDSTLKAVLQVWTKQKSYSVDDTIQYKGNYLKCTTAGTSGTTTLDFTGLDVGDIITDGTVVWELIEPPSGGVDLPEWQANTSYTAGKYLAHEGTVYKVDNDFTSGTTFSDTNLTSYIAPIMTGATSSTNGSSGLVPLPTTSDITKFLCGDGTWKSVGGSVAVARDILYTTTTPQSSGDVLALSKPYTDYDLLILYIGESNGVVASSVINPKDNDSAILIGYYRSSTNYYSGSVSFTSALSATIASIGTSGYGASNYLRRIEGIKLLSGTGLNVIDDTLWSGSFNSVVAGDTLTLHNDYADYDEIFLYVGGQGSKSLSTSLGSGIGYDNDGGNLGATYSYHVIITFSGNSCNAPIWQYGTNMASTEVRLVGRKYINPNNYSTTEQEIGTWIDGKPLYQRTLTGTCPSTTGSYVELTDLSSVGIASLTSIEGFVTDISGVDGNRNMWPICQSDAANSNKDISVILQMNQKLVMACKQNLSGQTYYITIKYTKV